MMFRTHPSEEWKQQLQKTGTSENGWTTHYRDPSTGYSWIEYFPYPEDRAPSYFRRDDLPDDLDRVLHMCLLSDDEEDWQGVGAHCSGAFNTEELAEALSRISGETSRRALREFGRFFHAYDNRKIVGMHYTEVEASYIRYLRACEKIRMITH